MKKIYLKPQTQMILVEVASMLASSTLNVSNETHNGAFNSREFDYEDEEED